MDGLIAGNPMVWVFVQTVDNVETYAGQYLEDLEVSFIPLFLEREQAEACLSLVPGKKGIRLELQAIRYLELARDAKRQGFLLFVLDADGNVLEKIAPAPEVKP